MNKKGFMIIAMVGMFAGLEGCANAGSEKVAVNSDEPVIIRILENDTAKEKGYLDALLDAFNEAYKEEQIVAVDANMDEYSNLAENGPYGYGPDVIYQANDKLMAYAEDKHILALNRDELECSDMIPQEAWDAMSITKEGTKYVCGVPINIQEPMLFYREDQLPDDWKQNWDDDQNDIPDFLENWNDLYAYSKTLRDLDESANRDSQYGFMTSWNNLYLNGEFLLSYGAYLFGNENGILDASDIGFGANNAQNGMKALKQFSALMNEGCIDDTIASTRYEKLADGTYFCSVSTPDTYTLFLQKLSAQYEAEGMDIQNAQEKAIRNLKMVELPQKLPADGDLTKDASALKDNEWVDTIVMGGVNGYGISSYTKNREACMKFVNFATSYDLISKRVELLGIAPTRRDVAQKTGGISDMIFDSLNTGRIYLMPSIKAIDQVWTPSQSFLGDIAKDSFREKKGESVKYADENSIQIALDKVSKDIYDAIYTLAN